MTSVLYDLRQPGLSENGSSLLDKLRDAFCASEENILVKYTETKVKQILMPSFSLNPLIIICEQITLVHYRSDMTEKVLFSGNCYRYCSGCLLFGRWDSMGSCSRC